MTQNQHNHYEDVWTNLKAKLDNLSNVWDNDGHLAFHQLIKNFHCLTGLLLKRTKKHNHETKMKE